MTTTYIPLATTTLASATNTVTFSSISASYTDLVLVINYQASGGAVYAQYRLNGDSGSNYRRNVISGNGSTAGNYNSGSESYMYAANTIYAGSGQWATLISNFNNYSNTTTNKTAIHRFSEATIGTEATISSWNSTAAINSITINTNANNFGIGSTFSLYGIASAAISGAKATGGDTIATDGTYWYHAFRGSGTFTPSVALTADVLVIAGGASGGCAAPSGVAGAGGGAGGLVYSTSQSFANATAHTVTIGAGGAGITYNAAAHQRGLSGSNSNVTGGTLSLTAAVGGGAGGVYPNDASRTALSGGSGGGGGADSGTGYTGAAGTSGQGNAGGNGWNGGGSGANGNAGGGGGAGAVGSNGALTTAGAGGAGTNTYSTWLSTTGLGVSSYIAGGGGGGSTYSNTAFGAGGSGGGGAGGYGTASALSNGSAGTSNTGSGGGGTAVFTGAVGGGNSGSGGSGLVIVRYPI